MDSPSEAGLPKNAPVGVREPFTLAERLQQLTDIDKDITKLLQLTNETLQPLSSPVTAPGSDATETPRDFANPAAINVDTQVDAFKRTMDAFLSTLHAVDVRLKRQIWGLEEAGIISLKESKSAGVSLEPNGVGDIGSLDVGWLNSRSNRVDRDMEAELWAKMKAVLGRLDEVKSGQQAGQMDVDG
ncbi:Mediator complex, subunit Med11 [Niveomyces insectorum RCEF 264]|uniref:Mediator of RNA polymerase II transcription subunit 11 n=1 Tax=Niveomyces insectorum RCEF 264 TaxID=1081102 RepID=A0A167MTE6_9HYPO|nr:Mediator complex, subunit Med11 [Niveomyces insectorum RCEF 264]